MTPAFARIATSILLGALTAFGLFWVMQALIGVSGELKEQGRRLAIDFVRLKRDNAPEVKEREPPQRQKPEQQPAPPEMNLAKNMNPGEAVGAIVPIVDTELALENAANLGAGSGDRGVVPLVRIEPEYPPRAKQQGIEGYVDVEFTISPMGTIQNAMVIESNPPFVFDRSALQAVRRWRYNPKTENGVAVARSGVQVRLRFEIPRSR